VIMLNFLLVQVFVWEMLLRIIPFKIHILNNLFSSIINVRIKILILIDLVTLTYIQSSATVSRRNARWLEFLL
jgi:hypothetical protein